MIDADLGGAILAVGWRFLVAVLIAVALIVGIERILETRKTRRELDDLLRGVRDRMNQK